MSRLATKGGRKVRRKGQREDRNEQSGYKEKTRKHNEKEGSGVERGQRK